MDRRKDTKSADVSEGQEAAEILVIATVYDTPNGLAVTSLRAGVVCSVYRTKDGRNTEFDVGLDQSRWREIPAGSDEEREMVDDTPQCNCVVRPSGVIRFEWEGGKRVCKSCRLSVEKKVYNNRMEQSSQKGGA